MRVAILAVPYDAGQRSVGVGLGPARLLEAGLANQLREAGNEVRQAMVELPDNPPLHELARIVELQRALAWAISHALAREEFPIVLAGNCSSAVGTLASRPRDTAVVWFDAHGDFNTPDTTTSGMVDGMALAMATGRCYRALAADIPKFAPIDERRVFLVGARDLDPLERRTLDSSPVQRIDAGDWRTLVSRLRALGPPSPPLYVHLDLDVLDPAHGRANRLAVNGGLSAKDLTAAIEALSAATQIFALAVTAYDPSFDGDGRACRAAFGAIRAAVPRDDVPE
jgi:arginase